MATTKKETTELKWKKKKWFQVISPKEFESQIVGETLANENKEIIGRTIQANLMYLTKNVKKQNLNLTFKIIEVKEGKGLTKSHRLEMLPASIKRMVRAGRDRVDESFIIKSKDGIYARVKPLLITKSHQPSAICTKLRKLSANLIRKYAAEVDFETFMRDAVDAKLQKTLRDKLSPLSQLRQCEIRAIEVIENFTALKRRKLEKKQEEDSAVQEEVVPTEEPVEEEAETTTTF